MDLEFTFKYKHYEIRACPKRLVKLRPTDKNETVELILWDEYDHTCFTLAYFYKTNEGYELKFVGSRPFRYIDDKDVKVLWSGLKHAQEILDEFFDAEDEEE